MSFSILTESPPIVVAHRGSSRKYPENTLCAFEAALSQGARWIETDITLTQDKFPVVIHDDTVDRTTNGSGNVKDLTLSEIQTFDAGSWFDPRFSNQAIPTLEQLLDLFWQQMQNEPGNQGSLWKSNICGGDSGQSYGHGSEKKAWTINSHFQF